MALQIDPKATVQSVEINDESLKFKTPCTMCISGPSMSGKSEFIVRLITFREKLFDTSFDCIIYCEPEELALRHNPIFEKIKNVFPNVQLIVGLPDVAKLHLNLDNRPKLLIIDDLMESFLQSDAMVKLLSIDVHHYNISTLYTLQNYFAPSRFGKTLSRNVNYRCLFYNRLDLTEVRTISIQISQRPRFLLDCFEFLKKEFQKEPPYLVIDGHVKSPLNELMVRSQIFPLPNGEMKPIFFFPLEK